MKHHLMPECIFCSRIINNAPSLSLHQKRCKSNPNRIPGTRSPLAGVKTGNIPWNAGKRTGRAAKWDELYPLEAVFVENSTYARSCLKRRIIAENLIPYVCKCCGSEPIWCGKPMPLILDHINGINNDNRLENLRFVCSNCDSQLITYKSRNRTK